MTNTKEEVIVPVEELDGANVINLAEVEDAVVVEDIIEETEEKKEAAIEEIDEGDITGIDLYYDMMSGIKEKIVELNEQLKAEGSSEKISGELDMENVLMDKYMDIANIGKLFEDIEFTMPTFAKTALEFNKLDKPAKQSYFRKLKHKALVTLNKIKARSGSMKSVISITKVISLTEAFCPALGEYEEVSGDFAANTTRMYVGGEVFLTLLKRITSRRVRNSINTTMTPDLMRMMNNPSSSIAEDINRLLNTMVGIFYTSEKWKTMLSEAYSDVVTGFKDKVDFTAFEDIHGEEVIDYYNNFIEERRGQQK